MQARVSNLWRHPIKAHGVEAVTASDFRAGETMPWDRVWAIAQEGARTTPESRDWVPCLNFSRGAKSPELMAIRAHTDEATGRLTLTHPRRTPLTVDPDHAEDAARLIAWVTPLTNPARPAPAFVARAGRGMTDSSFASVAILNTASLRALTARMGRALAQERFRGNIWLDGLAPWQEFDLLGRDLRIGTATFRVRNRITRCKATTVDPATGISDADTLAALEDGWRHQDFGVYAEVIASGRVAVGDEARLA